MAGTPTQHFVYDGHPMADWLWEMVCDDIHRRQRAHLALSAMRGMDVDYDDHPDFQIGGWYAAWDAEVQRTLAAPGFDAPRFIRRLAAFMREAQAQRMGLFNRENARADHACDRIAVQLKDPDLSEARKATLMKRLSRVICSGCAANEATRTQDLLLAQQVTAAGVFQALGEHVLRTPEVIRAMLADRHESYNAVRVIEKLGPAAAAFRDDLFAELDRAVKCYDFQWPKALAVAIGDDARQVVRIVERVDSENVAVATGAASVLSEVGPGAAELVPGCLAKLIARTAPGHPARGAMIHALGVVGRERDAVVTRLLEVSREPDMWVRGAAITALGHARHRPDLVVPRLIEGFSDYEEQDPDYTYSSRHERVATALGAFGPAAAPAVPALVARIRRDEGMDRTVVAALAAIGPAAAAALPKLERLFAEGGCDESDLDDELSPLGRAIRNIRGDQSWPNGKHGDKH